MKEKGQPPIKKDASAAESTPSTLRHRGFHRYLISFCIILATGILGMAIFLLPASVMSNKPNIHDFALLKNQTEILNNRVDSLEAKSKEPLSPSLESERLKDFDTRLSSLTQQLETFKNQPKVEVTAQEIERTKNLDKDIQRLGESQKILKSHLLFWRLRTQILSGAPYTSELSDFKTTTQEIKDLSILEKYANKGLHGLKEGEKTSQTFLENTKGSWWSRFKAMGTSFIRIEKIDETESLTPEPFSGHHDIENALNEIDQTLTHKLKNLSLSSSSTPHSGDQL
ncbi:MAG: hypothetical protein FJX03_02150 [Alphaproteobacteria bacterium]|nr:hypothetical protein [Alphaproteobacteria bacterium]